MTRILVLYYSSYGHIEQMAHAQAEGVRKVDGVEAVVIRHARTGRLRAVSPGCCRATAQESERGQRLETTEGRRAEIKRPRTGSCS